uniref:Uncharacterized protein n=1 Tax=viral metagenome TaxID=1070528 RepID=A0A6M3KLJ9_9ZZZZ
MTFEARLQQLEREHEEFSARLARFEAALAEVDRVEAAQAAALSDSIREVRGRLEDVARPYVFRPLEGGD